MDRQHEFRTFLLSQNVLLDIAGLKCGMVDANLP